MQILVGAGFNQYYQIIEKVPNIVPDQHFFLMQIGNSFDAHLSEGWYKSLLRWWHQIYLIALAGWLAGWLCNYLFASFIFQILTYTVYSLGFNATNIYSSTFVLITFSFQTLYNFSLPFSGLFRPRFNPLSTA